MVRLNKESIHKITPQRMRVPRSVLNSFRTEEISRTTLCIL
jgi:hypothetical protein